MSTEKSQHWVVSVRDSCGDYREMQITYLYFDGTQAEAEYYFMNACEDISRFIGYENCHITMAANPVVLQESKS